MAKSSAATTAELTMDQVLARLEAVEAQAARVQALEAENQILRDQLKQTSGGRQITVAEANAAARDVIAKSTRKPTEGKHEWRIRITPKRKTNGKPTVYARELTFRCDEADVERARMEYNLYSGMTLSAQNSQFELLA